MAQNWKPGCQYNAGDEVIYESHKYVIIQPHRSQSDWCPAVTPALWGRVKDDGGCEKGYEHSYGYDGDHGGVVPQVQQYSHEEISHEEKKSHWAQLDDGRKKKIEMAGGLVGGLALLGAGYAAFKHHQKSEEEKTNMTWALSNWVNDAKTRTDHCRGTGPPGPCYWILNESNVIPKDAIQIGNESDNQPLFSCRAFYEGGVHPGKCAPHLSKGACVPYDGKEVEISTYEVLCGSSSHTRWVQAHGCLNSASLGRLVEGGKEADGTPLYVSRAPCEGGVHPGKCSEKLDGCSISHNGREKMVKEYEVLVYTQ